MIMANEIHKGNRPLHNILHHFLHARPVLLLRRLNCSLLPRYIRFGRGPDIRDLECQFLI